MWSPDVYQGAPTPFTAFLSVGSNAAGVAIMIRFFFPAASRLVEGGNWLFISGVEWPHVLLFVSMITMTVGNLCALNQQNVKRLLAYSGIAHAGYILMGLVVLNNDGLKAMLFYIVVYLVMNLGAFLVVMIVGNATGRDDLEGYRGLAWRGAAGLAACMAIFLFSLTGLPPLGGFVGKFFLFAAVIKQGGEFVILALVAIVNSVISLYYYARIVKIMFLDSPEPNSPTVAMTPTSFALLGVLTTVTILFGVYFGPLLQYTNESLKFFIR
jgi:NADH-quinone oxidoreductase subunit N